VDFARRLEPRGSRILHGAGQSHRAFCKYAAALPDRLPVIYMSYVSVKVATARWFEWLGRLLGQFRDVYLIPQIGLSITRDGSPEMHYEEDVARGEYDDRLDEVVEGLKRLDRPAFLRIGFEFNGHWNGYEPPTYVAAWRRISERIASAGLDRVARVWCYAPDGINRDWGAFYPGDEHVDWWAIDTFSVQHFSQADSIAFCREAERRRFPVMIGESTPRYVGVQDGAASWQRWFAPYFRFMADLPAIKAFCYINWEWSPYPRWSDWGDGRLETNAEVLARWRETLADEIFLHGRDEQATREALCVEG
jgi:hypothetical protein